MKDEIAMFQRSILNGLANLEARIGVLYKAYDALFPSELSIWGIMANEELAHARMLESLNKELDEGHLFWNIGLFGEAAVAEQTTVVDAALKRAHDFNVTEHEALEVAIAIEKSLLERHFYTTVKSDSKVFPHIASALLKATEGHIRKLQQKIMDGGIEKDWI
jgi:hypothetical protein